MDIQDLEFSDCTFDVAIDVGVLLIRPNDHILSAYRKELWMLCYAIRVLHGTLHRTWLKLVRKKYGKQSECWCLMESS